VECLAETSRRETLFKALSIYDKNMYYFHCITANPLNVTELSRRKSECRSA